MQESESEKSFVLYEEAKKSVNSYNNIESSSKIKEESENLSEHRDKWSEFILKTMSRIMSLQILLIICIAFDIIRIFDEANEGFKFSLLITLISTNFIEFLLLPKIIVGFLFSKDSQLH